MSSSAEFQRLVRATTEVFLLCLALAPSTPESINCEELSECLKLYKWSGFLHFLLFLSVSFVSVSLPLYERPTLFSPLISNMMHILGYTSAICKMKLLIIMPSSVTEQAAKKKFHAHFKCWEFIKSFGLSVIAFSYCKR